MLIKRLFSNSKLHIKILAFPVFVITVAFVVTGVLIVQEAVEKGNVETVKDEMHEITSIMRIVSSNQNLADALYGL